MHKHSFKPSSDLITTSYSTIGGLCSMELDHSEVLSVCQKDRWFEIVVWYYLARPCRITSLFFKALLARNSVV